MPRSYDYDYHNHFERGVILEVKTALNTMISYYYDNCTELFTKFKLHLAMEALEHATLPDSMNKFFEFLFSNEEQRWENAAKLIEADAQRVGITVIQSRLGYIIMKSLTTFINIAVDSCDELDKDHLHRFFKSFKVNTLLYKILSQKPFDDFKSALKFVLLSLSKYQVLKLHQFSLLHNKLKSSMQH